MSSPATDSGLRLHRPDGLTTIVHAAMATEFALHLGGHEPEYLRQAAAEAIREIDRLEATLSFYQESSEVTRLNRAPANTDVTVGADTLACLAIAAEASRLTGGAFDAFTGRAALAAKKQEVPASLRDAPSAAADDLPGPVVSVGDGTSVIRKLRAGPWLDLGALGKGYALDVVAALLADWDITAGFLSAGGSSLRGLGGERWTLELSTNRTLMLPGVFCLGASGFQFQAGHIIDARSERTQTVATRAVALAPSAALADALSTAAMLLPTEQLSRIAGDAPGASLFIVDANGNRRGYGAPFEQWTAEHADGAKSGTLLAIPCFGDGERLARWLPQLCGALEQHAPEVTVQVVDDGSPPAEQDALRTAIDHLRVTHESLQPLIALAQNTGKGAAIQRAWQSSPHASWLAFVDADGAVPVPEVLAVISRARNSTPSAVCIAERRVVAGKVVARLWYRNVGSRLFNRWVRMCLGLKFSDTQCGLKLIPASLHAIGNWTETGFAFDLELLLRARAHRTPVETMPIAWEEKPGSTLGMRAMAGLFASVWRLRTRAREVRA